jgi:hypothetical protein
MSDPIIHSYKVTTSNVDVIGTPTCTFNNNTHKVAINFKYLINSWNAGSYAVQYKATPDGGSVGSYTNAFIIGATNGTNGGVLKAKNRQVSQDLTWQLFKDLLPLKYSSITVKVTLTDSGSNTTNFETTMSNVDCRYNIKNLKQIKHGTDALPTFEFNIPAPKKSVNIAPVFELGTNAKLDTVDHTQTVFEVWNGSAWVAGSAQNGNPVTAGDGTVKMRTGAVTGQTISGTEYWRIKLVPKSFV